MGFKGTVFIWRRNADNRQNSKSKTQRAKTSKVCRVRGCTAARPPPDE